MRRLVLLTLFLCSIGSLHAATIISLCTGGPSAGCAGTWSYSYVANDNSVKTGSAALLTGSSLYDGWVNVNSNCKSTGCGWISVQNRAALQPAGIALLHPGDTDPIYGTTTDPRDLGGQHTWTNPYPVYYSVTFDVTGYSLSSVRFSWSWAADDNGYGVVLNGDVRNGATGLAAGTALPCCMEAYNRLTSMNDVTLSGLRDGVNTISFVANNADSWYDGINVAQLKISGDADDLATPEPGSLALIAGGICLLAFRGIRSRMIKG